MAEAEAAQREDYQDDPIRDAREAFRQAGEKLMDITSTVLFILEFTGNTVIATSILAVHLKKEMEDYLKNPWDRSKESDSGLADLLKNFNTSELLLQQSQILTRLFNLIEKNFTGNSSYELFLLSDELKKLQAISSFSVDTLKEQYNSSSSEDKAD